MNYPGTKYRRLLRMALRLSLFCAVCGFVLGYLWDYGLSAQGITQDILFQRGLDAMKKGLLFGGLYFSFPMWLAREKFDRPKKSSPYPGSFQ